jgi:glutathione S-transferase
MIKLYGAARSRATIVRWCLEELALPYEMVMLDLQAGEHRQAAFLDINPFGKVPAIVDGDLILYETGAILIYLDCQYAKPNRSAIDRAKIAQWVLFANSTFSTGMFIEASRDKEMPKLMPPLDRLLSEQPYLLGDEFTVADIALGAILTYIPLMLQLDLSEYSAVTRYMGALAERPAFKRGWAGRE